MLILRIFAWLFPFGMMILGNGTTFAQDYPYKPIRLVTSGAGGVSDITARLIAQGLTSSLGHSVIVDNRPSNIAPETVSKAPSDGYTLLLASNPFWIGPLLQKMPYDPVRDFSPIICVNKSSPVLVVSQSVMASSVGELIKLAKANPGVLNYAASGTGAGSHMAAELFKAMAGVNMVLINYKGVPAAINDLIGGRVQLMIVSAATVMPHARSGKLKALAITSAEPSALVPDLPTVAASGLPGYEVATFLGILAPAKASELIINRINQETVRVINRKDVKEKFFIAGLEIVGDSPKQFAGTIKSEIAKWSKVINDAGIRAE